MIKKLWALGIALVVSGSVAAQMQAEFIVEDPYELTLEQLMSIPIVSVSKEKESSFAAPVTSYVITHSDIVNSGALTIPEALRMAPALLVRETANGVFDVSIRGGKDNLPAYGLSFMNNSILVMINNRPVFNYLSGGTHWQDLPVHVADVERIEIVYGPNAPLYGPNAVDGVINIITQKSSTGTYGNATVQAGTGLAFSALIGSQLSDKVGFNLSANHGQRKRHETEFYDFVSNQFISDLGQHSNPNISSNPFVLFPDPDVSVNRTGLNFNLYYQPGKKTNITFNAAHNSSLYLYPSVVYTNVSQTINKSTNYLVRVESGNFTLQSSYVYGKNGISGYLPEDTQDYSTLDNYIDYNFKITDKFSLRPAFSYQSAMFDDTRYTVDAGKSGVFNNKATMYNYAFSVKGDYNINEKFRVIGAIRADKFKAPDDVYISYQAIANYKVNEHNILRFFAGRSHAGSFILPTYMNVVVEDYPMMLVNGIGNEDLDLLQNNILEVGYKAKLSGKVSIDVSVFRQSYRNYSAQLTRVVSLPSFDPPARGEFEFKQRNIAMESDQTGVTVAATALFGRVAVKPSITYQRNDLTNYSPYYSDPHPILFPENNWANTQDIKSPYTPDLFGGFSLSAPVKKWNFSVTGYYYSSYKLNNVQEANVQTGALLNRPLQDVDGKILLNANVLYRINDNVNVFLNGRNLIGQDHQEAYASEKIGRLVFAGFNLKL